MVGSERTSRGAALKRAIAALGPLAVRVAWPLQDALAAGRNADTAVIVLDRFPSSPELRAMADVTAVRKDLGVLVLGPLVPNTEVLIALASGAAGYLPSDSAPLAVAHAVDNLLGGQMVLPRDISLPLVQDLRWTGRGVVVTGLDGRAAELTNREWETLVLLRQGRSTLDIARRLAASNATVRSHVSAVLHKLGAHDRSTLAPRSDTATNVDPRPSGPGTSGGGTILDVEAWTVGDVQCRSARDDTIRRASGTLA